MKLKKTGQKTREHTYINCWHLNNYESEAMWKLYSKDYANAIAIQTTTKSIYEAIDKDPYIPLNAHVIHKPAWTYQHHPSLPY